MMDHNTIKHRKNKKKHVASLSSSSSQTSMKRQNSKSQLNKENRKNKKRNEYLFVTKVLKITLIIVLAVGLRSIIGLHPHSGQGQAPHYGDFEAQRHWMELTTKIPLLDWYVETADNSLDYWGLDYPPLTAYHSYLMGKCAEWFGIEELTALHTSRGIETTTVKAFMRFTVLLADVFIFFPAVYFFLLVYYKDNLLPETFEYSLFLAISQPTNMMIDHGHFQYNNIGIGLAIAAAAFIVSKHYFVGSMLFCLSLNFKIIGLYYALPFFFFLLGVCFFGNQDEEVKEVKPSFAKAITRLVKIGLVVLLTFFALWYPFLPRWKDVLHRIFPFERGLYQDYVASAWCFLQPLKHHFTPTPTLCAIVTLLTSLPANMKTFFKPTRFNFLFSLILTSFSFFMFSYHVHEKTILYPLAFSTLLVQQNAFLNHMIPLLIAVSMFSMFPLFVTDRLVLAYIALQLFNFVFFAPFDGIHLNWPILSISSRSRLFISKLDLDRGSRSHQPLNHNRSASVFSHIIYVVVLSGMLFIHALMVFVNPPANYPYLWDYACVSFSFICFFGFWCVSYFIFIFLDA